MHNPLEFVISLGPDLRLLIPGKVGGVLGYTKMQIISSGLTFG